MSQPPGPTSPRRAPAPTGRWAGSGWTGCTTGRTSPPCRSASGGLAPDDRVAHRAPAHEARVLERGRGHVEVVLPQCRGAEELLTEHLHGELHGHGSGVA